MQCPNCGQHTEEGIYCTSCGSRLTGDSTHEHPAQSDEPGTLEETTEAASQTDDSTINDTPPVQQSSHGEQSTQPPNETVERLKTTGSDFGRFFMTLVKGPSETKKANGSDMSSGIIMFILFSLVIALSYHLALSSMPMGFFSEVSFFDSFILPFLLFLILYFAIAGITFAGAKLAVQAVKFPDVIAKYGAYLVPFLLLYVAGMLFLLIGLSALSSLLIALSILGMLLIAPTFILFEQPSKGFDRIYVLLGLYMIILLVFGFFLQSFLQTILGSFLNMMSGGMFP